MDSRAAKLANARKKLRDHQEKKSVCLPKDEGSDTLSSIRAATTDKNGTEQRVTHKDEHNLINNNATEINKDNEINVEHCNYFSNNQDITAINDEKRYSNVTEILISNKTDLETQNKELQSKISQLEHILSSEISEHNCNKQKLSALEFELNNAYMKQSMLNESITTQNTLINDLRNQVKNLTDDNNNLIEQQEFTVSMLTAKEMEITQLQSQVNALQNQVDVTSLQLQQLTSDTNVKISQEPGYNKETELLKEKIALLEHELENSLKEKDNINSHYEHYMNKLNEQIKSQATKNEALTAEVKSLSNRESALIEQMSHLEIRMQNYRSQSEAYAESHNNSYILQLKDKVATLEAELDKLHNKYNDLQKQYDECVNTIQELNQTKAQEFAQDNISIEKLNADITSDKIAAQRATEQNKKLKTDIEGLEQIVIKLGKDKLELTEKLSHEHELNKQLMLKLAEVDEMLKQTQTKLKAKDEEMIRLQASYREIEYKHEALLENLLQSKENTVSGTNKCDVDLTLENKPNGVVDEEKQLISQLHDCSGDCTVNTCEEGERGNKIPKDDAMHKLQERFLHIMDQVANLSDEKHRLEHIILQLQTETDTICEYVALYQQQRSLLKKRDEERSAQIKLFQMECDEVKHQLNELSGLFLRLAQDQDLAPYLQMESRHRDIAKIKSLLEDLLNSNLINSKCKNLELQNFYPCNCCSGQLIDV